MRKLSLLLAVSGALAVDVFSAGVPEGLQTEFMLDPIGIDAEAPRLSWRLPKGCCRQRAYEIEADGRTCGKVGSGDQFGVEWPGDDLEESSRHAWRVRIWNERGEVSDWSDPATFVMGRSGTWCAKWITRNGESSLAFAKTFSVTGDVVRATLHVGAAGFCETSLNGARVGDKVLDPSPTQYDHRVFYSTYILDGKIVKGENELKILLGHGWYDVRALAAWNFREASWRAQPRVIAELKLEFADGRVERVVTDGSWRVVSSPVIYDDMREGEVVRNGDVNPRAIAGESADEVEPPANAVLTASGFPGAKVREEIAPERIVRLEDGSWMVVFPANIAGWIRLRLHGQERDSIVTVRYDERVGEEMRPAADSWLYGRRRESGLGTITRRIDCHFYEPASARVLPRDPGAFQTDRIICSGEDETYEPRFTYNGFKYVWIRGLTGELSAADVTGCFVQTDFRTVGRFESSDKTLNGLIALADRSYRCNFTDGVPTDCPHREKNGWTGDAQVASEFAQYLYENTAAYEKWIGDLCCAQRRDGNLPGIVPTGGWGFAWGNGPAWDSALAIIPWNLYCYRGDRRILGRVYPVLRKYIAYTQTRADADNLVSHGLGDWLPPDRNRVASVKLTSSCYWYLTQRITAKIAALLGERSAAVEYEDGARRTKEAFNRLFYKGGGVYEDGLQCAQAMPLAFGLVSQSEVPAVRARLVEACEQTDGTIDFGLLGSKHVFRQLSEAGRGDLAFRMLTSRKGPSPVKWLDAGYGTLWEDWHDGASRNHVMFGDYVAWAFQYLAGIRLSEDADSCTAIPTGSVAFGKILFAPMPIPQLDFVRASTETPYGTVRAAWKRIAGKIEYEFEVPPGVVAEVRLPGERSRNLKTGVYRFGESSLEEMGGVR